MKIKYLLLYGIPALIIDIWLSVSLFNSFVDFLYNLYPEHFVENTIAVSAILSLSGLYWFYAFKQDNINKYTKWSILSWYIGIATIVITGVIAWITLQGKGIDGMAAYFVMPYVYGVVLAVVVISVVCAHATGLIKSVIKPKFWNLFFVVTAVLTMGIVAVAVDIF